MSQTSNFVLNTLLVIAWLIFVGLCIEGGALLVNFIFSMFKPHVVQNLYQNLDLTAIYNSNKFSFYSIYSLLLFISILKAYLFYIVIMLMHKMDLKKPFNSFVSNQILQMSYYTISIGLLSYLARSTTKKMVHQEIIRDSLNQFWADSQAYVLMGAVIYIIAIIFKKGVEIQNENDLTV